MYEIIVIWLLVATSIVLRYGNRWSKSESGAPIVRSLIPWVGDAIQYGKDPMKYFARCRERYGSAFKVLLAGRSITIICDAKGIDSIFRDKTKAFNTHPVHLQLAQALGGVKRATDIIQILNQQLFPLVTRSLSREKMDHFAPSLNEGLFRSVEAMAQTICDAPGGASFSLMPLIGESLYSAICKATFGPRYPIETYPDFETCDTDLVLLLARIPMLGRKASQAQARLLRAITDYIDDASSEDQTKGASPMATEMLSILKDADIEKSDIAGTLLTIIWGMMSNTIHIPYWLMVFLLNDPSAATKIREEVDSELRDHFGGDRKRLLAAPFTALDDRFPLIDSAIKETLRMTILLSALREAHADTEVVGETGKIRIRKGEMIMANVSAVHTDERYFDNPGIFRVDRFIGTEKKKPSHWGFGGGAHLCKGRLLALHVAKIFVVLCFDMFDMDLLDANGNKSYSFMPGYVVRMRVGGKSMLLLDTCYCELWKQSIHVDCTRNKSI